MINAVLNNAAWVASMCRAHGVATHRDDSRWWSPSRTPMFYPDAVSLAPGLEAAAVLDGVDAGPGASVKDSFADLDLSGHGFFTLFEASWIGREAAAGESTGWRAVTTAEELADWEARWGDATGLFVPALLDDADVRIIATDEGGFVLNRAAGVIGVSNAHGPVWPLVPGAALALFGDLPLVGYESGDDLDPALAAGFAVTGPLRVWLRS